MEAAPTHVFEHHLPANLRSTLVETLRQWVRVAGLSHVVRQHLVFRLLAYLT